MTTIFSLARPFTAGNPDVDAEPLVLVVAADAAVRQEMATRLKSLHLDVLCCRSPGEFFETYDADRPGCALWDVPHAGSRDLELLERLREQGPHLPVVVFSAAADVPLAVRAMKLGAADFLPWPCPGSQFAEAVGEALRWDTEGRRRIARVAGLRARLSRLTPGQRAVLDRLVLGRSNAEIAEELGLSLRTIEDRRAKTMKAMRARSLAELVRLVMLAEPP